MGIQRAAVFVGSTTVQLELPPLSDEVLPGVRWGAVDAFPTPAYWLYQVLAHRLAGRNSTYRIGNTLAEEVAACLLGGHGLPAAVGIAAFEALRVMGLFARPASQEEIELALSAPLIVGGRALHYRFARQKARYLSAALKRVHTETPPLKTGKLLRDWLLDIPGIGPKTASWVARNWLSADDVAILDIHILRAGILGSFLTPDLTVDRHYLQLEEEFLTFSHALGVRASELDAIIWLEMMNSTKTIRRLMNPSPTNAGPRANESRANPHQASLID